MKVENHSKKDENKGSLTKALGPLIGNALISGQLFKAEAEHTEADPDILTDYGLVVKIINETINLNKKTPASL